MREISKGRKSENGAALFSVFFVLLRAVGGLQEYSIRFYVVMGIGSTS